MPLVLQEARDVRRASGAQRLGKGLNGGCWYDGVVESVGQEDGSVDLVHEVEGRAALITREAVRERPDEAVQLVLLELVRPPAELEQVNDAGHSAGGRETSLRTRARRAAKPPALAPEMTVRAGSARRTSASQRATVMQSSASAMPQTWLRAWR